MSAMKYAQALQGLAVDSISEMFNSEAVIDLNNTSIGELTRAQLEADSAGKRAEFDAALAKQIMPILDQILNPPQPQQSGGEASVPIQ